MAATHAELNPSPYVELTWQPDGREPQVCHPDVTNGYGCAEGGAYRVTFILVGTPSRVTLWLFPAHASGEHPDTYIGAYVVGWRWRQECGDWWAGGYEYNCRLISSLPAACDAALNAAVDLACGGPGYLPKGTFECLDWDGVPYDA